MEVALLVVVLAYEAAVKLDSKRIARTWIHSAKWAISRTQVALEEDAEDVGVEAAVAVEEVGVDEVEVVVLVGSVLALVSEGENGRGL